MNFGKYIESLRMERDLSQRQLAELAGISNTEIWRIESGERKKPSPGILKVIAPHLCVTYEELMVKAGYIEETVEHKSYSELIYRDSDGNLADIIKKAKEMQRKDSDWANIAYRISTELSKDDINAIKAVAMSLLNKGKK